MLPFVKGEQVILTQNLDTLEKGSRGLVVSGSIGGLIRVRFREGSFGVFNISKSLIEKSGFTPLVVTGKEHTLITRGETVIAEVWLADDYEQSRKDAERLCLSWNACEGIENEVLVGSIKGADAFKLKIIELVFQIEDLKEAIQSVVEDLEGECEPGLAIEKLKLLLAEDE